MAKVAVCNGDFYSDWAGNLKCSGNQYNIEELHLHNSSVNTRLDNLEVFNSAFDSRLSNLEGILSGSIPSFDITAIDPNLATGMFTAGFLLCAVPWAAFFGIAKILQSIREF